MSSFMHFQGQTTNACAFLLINECLNKNKEQMFTTNHRSPREKRFANYALKTGMEGVVVIQVHHRTCTPSLGLSQCIVS
jgi:hypothetical protein